MPEKEKPSAGHVLAPPQISCASQGPAGARQMVAAGAGPTARQRVGPQANSPSSQGLPVEHAAPGVQAELHAPRPSQLPKGQATPVATKVSVAQSAVPVVQRSAASQGPVAARQAVLAGARASAGHSEVVPLQVSATSQGPWAARHEVPAGCPAQGAAPQSRAQLPAQQLSPLAQRGVRSQRPAAQLAFSQGAATQVVVVQAGEHPVAGSAIGSVGTHALAGQATSLSSCPQTPPVQVSVVQANASAQSAGPPHMPPS